MPALLFSYENNGIPEVGVVIGNNTQYFPQNNPNSTGYYYAFIGAPSNPILFFENSVLFLIDYGYVKTQYVITDPVYPSIGVYDIETNTFTYTQQLFQSDSIFDGWIDSQVDYKNQMLYLLAVNTNLFIILLFAVPFSGLPTLLNNLQLPQNFEEASLVLPNGWSNYNPASEPCTILYYSIYYNETFYLLFSDTNNNIDLWVFSLNEITWSSSIPTSSDFCVQTSSGEQCYSNAPSNAQVVGSVTTIQTGYVFAFAPNYYINNGSIYFELLALLFSNNNYLIISINPDTLSVTTVGTINFYQSSLSTYLIFCSTAYIAGGLIIIPTTLYNGSTCTYWYIFVYDRNTGETALFSPPQNALLVIAGEGGYIISLTGSPTNVTITVYQVVSDSAPVITNVQLQNNTITGTAMNLVSNTPASGVVVLFQLEAQGGYNFAGEIVATTTTDSNGNFSFQVSQPGYYAIRAFT